MQDYVVIDLEMTGLNAKTDHILEVGAVRVRNHQAVDKFGAILCRAAWKKKRQCGSSLNLSERISSLGRM